MEELFKKIKKYKDSVDGPFFCIISDAHATASLLKNVSAGVILKGCFDAVWEASSPWQKCSRLRPSWQTTSRELLWAISSKRSHTLK